MYVQKIVQLNEEVDALQLTDDVHYERYEEQQGFTAVDIKRPQETLTLKMPKLKAYPLKPPSQNNTATATGKAVDLF